MWLKQKIPTRHRSRPSIDTHILEFEELKLINYIGTTYCGLDVYKNLNNAPSGVKVSDKLIADWRVATCKRCRNAHYEKFPNMKY